LDATTQPTHRDDQITINLDRSRPNNNSRSAKGRKAAPAAILYEETLKQRKTLGKFQKAEAKLRLNINYMKSRLLESQLEEKGISFELPFPNIEIPSSDESDGEEEN
jgi:hypothetical protein